MLLRYNISNFLSFNEKREFNMIPGKTKKLKEHVIEEDGISLLKSALIYGANAAGKSNFIKSIDFMKRCVLKGIKQTNTIDKYYKLNEENKEKLTEFEIEVKIGKKIYAYGFNLNLMRKEVNEEWLYEVQKKKDVLIFNRNKEGIEIGKEIKNMISTEKMKFEVYKNDLEKSELLMEVLSKKKWEQEHYDFIKVFKWFKESLITIFPDTNEFLSEYYTKKNLLIDYLRCFDTGITGIKFIEKNFSELSIPEEIKVEMSNDISEVFNKKAKSFKIMAMIDETLLRLFLKNGELKSEEVVFTHENRKGVFRLTEESDGTRRLLELIPLLEEVKCSSKVVLIDELERSLHPVLVTKFLELLYKNVENKNSQFIVATHESRLLDLDLVRRDEVWFAERDPKEGTKLYSLDDYNIRYDSKVDKGYLLGRFGGIPEFKGLKDVKASCVDNG